MKNFILDATFVCVTALGIWTLFDMDGAADFILLVGRTFYPILPG
jgi:hypothetical protein